MRLRLHALIFLLTGLGWSAAACAGDPGLILVYPSQGTGQQFTICGRFIEDDGVRRAKKKTSKWRNLYNNYKVLESDEIEDAVIEVTVNGESRQGTTDDDGVFEIPFTFPSKDAMRPGRYPIAARTLKDKGHPAPPTTGVLFVLPAEGVAVISDIDDTILHTGVTSKRKLLKNALLKNAAQVKPVKGAAEAYLQARKAGASGVFYLSGSPQNFVRRIHEFLVRHRFPEGPILLKNFGTDPTFDQETYKIGRLRRIFEGHPGMRFVLVGDSGEKDPELYRKIRKMFPRQVAGILIRRVAGGANDPQRFTGMTVIDDHRQSPDALVDLVKTAAR